MKKLLTIIIALFLFSSCSMFEEKEDYVQLELAKYFEAYQMEASYRGVEWNPTGANYTIKITKNLESKEGNTNVAGLATTKRNGKKLIIEIDKDIYDLYKDDEYWNFILEYIMIHECGHAFLNYKHDQFDEGHIMHPTTNKGDYLNNKESMLNDFFK